MNVEINFLEKKKKRNVAPYLITFLSILFLSLVVGATFFQGKLISNEIADNTKEFTQLEASVSDYQGNLADQRNLAHLQKTVDKLLQNSFPTVSIYQDVLKLLENEDQLLYYQQNTQQQFVLETKFTNLDSVTVFISELLELTYVTDVHLDGVHLVEKGYEANLTVTFDETAVKKELSSNE
ncbi:hypothetical protein [Ornithinibacillus scapharcae]|uniref:hypothetical protein n=1 Tax=Ornithinibacillus scapharcae TaxID=1147159 RepID=UPI000225C182|nr:hypothetical protein [Ornithinibacillus scapharcae]